MICILLIIAFCLLICAYVSAGGFGPILSQPGKFNTGSEFWKFNVLYLYNPAGRYTFKKGFNMKAIYALMAGAFIALVGLVIPPLSFLYDYA